ncbi:MAG TPA: hypothetical protein PK863_04990 [Candidatus Dojkabacteria bacterium]|nr:hypothetical protein [Candidatus Dojkabacteria bacterium]HRP36736.1 hypothetical protein [Candidatus Dojkabacteria bacterium]HRP51300.1 hypothetical protein [Candidatus Dojkabacteria bacterium]
MDSEFTSKISELAPIVAVPLGLALVYFGGRLIHRLSNSEDPLMQGRKRYIESGDIEDLHQEDGMREALKKGETPGSMLRDIANRE